MPANAGIAVVANTTKVNRYLAIVASGVGVLAVVAVSIPHPNAGMDNRIALTVGEGAMCTALAERGHIR